MAGFRDIDTSDAASSLPPLAVVDPDHVLTVLDWHAANEGVLSFRELLPDDTHGGMIGDNPAVVYLSVRGWSSPPPGAGRSEWQQVHLAIPRDYLLQIVAALAQHIA